MKAIAFWGMLAGIVVLPQSLPPVATVPKVDLQRYLGDWYEIARYANRFQTKCLGDVRASYAKRTDGRIDVTNRCRTSGGVDEAAGVARIVDTSSSAKLAVRFAPAFLSFLPMVWGDYWIIGLASDYSWAVVGTPDREYLWVLSRTSQLPQPSWDAALAAVRGNQFDEKKLVKTPQTSKRP